MAVTKAPKEGKSTHTSREGQPKAEEPPTLDYVTVSAAAVAAAAH